MGPAGGDQNTRQTLLNHSNSRESSQTSLEYVIYSNLQSTLPGWPMSMPSKAYAVAKLCLPDGIRFRGVRCLVGVIDVLDSVKVTYFGLLVQ